MDQEQSSGQCEGCDEPESSFIHTVSEDDVFRRFCTDCLLKDDEHKRRFCPICITVYDVPPPNARIKCYNCLLSFSHRDCLPPPGSIFTCPPCSAHSFTFFPRTYFPRSSDDEEEDDYVDDGSRRQLIDNRSAKALVVAAKLAMDNLDQEVTLLKKIADEKILESVVAKRRVKVALCNLQDLLFQQEVSVEEYNPKRRKISV